VRATGLCGRVRKRRERRADLARARIEHEHLERILVGGRVALGLEVDVDEQLDRGRARWQRDSPIQLRDARVDVAPHPSNVIATRRKRRLRIGGARGAGAPTAPALVDDVVAAGFRPAISGDVHVRILAGLERHRFETAVPAVHGRADQRGWRADVDQFATCGSVTFVRLAHVTARVALAVSGHLLANVIDATLDRAAHGVGRTIRVRVALVANGRTARIACGLG